MVDLLYWLVLPVAATFMLWLGTPLILYFIKNPGDYEYEDLRG